MSSSDNLQLKSSLPEPTATKSTPTKPALADVANSYAVSEEQTSDKQMSDQQLMQNIAAGDKSAFASLYDRHVPTIYAVCLKILRTDSEAEAAVSGIFLEVWRKPHGFDARRGTCRTYLLTLASSRAIDRWRALGTRVRKTQNAGQLLVNNAAAQQLQLEPSSLAETSERQQAIRIAVSH